MRSARQIAPFSATTSSAPTGMSGAAARRPAKNWLRTRSILAITLPVHATGISSVMSCLRRSLERTRRTNPTRSVAACCKVPTATGSPASASSWMAGASAAKSGAWCAVAQVDELVHVRRAPDLHHRGNDAAGLLTIESMERTANRVDANPVARAFVSQS